MPNATGATERQKCLFGAAQMPMSNNWGWRQIGGTVRVLLDPLVTQRDAEIVMWTF